jgi:hypothetical protein
VLVRTSQLECCREFQSMDQGNNSCWLCVTTYELSSLATAAVYVWAIVFQLNFGYDY